MSSEIDDVKTNSPRSRSNSVNSPRSRSSSLSSSGGRSRSGSLSKGQKKKAQKKRSKMRVQLEQQGLSPEEIEKAISEMQESEKEEEEEVSSPPLPKPEKASPKPKVESVQLRRWAQQKIPSRTGKTYLEKMAERTKQNNAVPGPTARTHTDENGAPLRKWATMSSLGRYRSTSLPRGRSYKELVAQKQAEQQREEARANLSQKILKQGELEFITESNPVKAWETGFFTLSDSTLIYFDQEDQELPTCIVDLAGATAEEIEHKEREFCFKISSPIAHSQDTVLKGHVMILSANSQEQRDQWLRLMKGTSEDAKEEAQIRRFLNPLTRYQLEKLIVELKRTKQIEESEIKALIKEISLPSQQVE